ncbi:hypothetical protein H2200_009986 [Cladophialophora chaetospira]|uniref:Vps72/YL1 C-terminal domain-containing protein n=1 Tax=Cladophialophora chaetospira TaxID=386627 RepID=A0AA39CEK5_9EURO|nr:hypothetical protein H2200_009986 [Cladophialophora chaetospira]
MADDELMDDASQLSDTDSSDGEVENAPVKSLVAGRERRKTAGNRYDRTMVLEEAADAEDPDEVTLLFADNEEEEDEEFKSDAEAEDADMSSSDDDDQGPNAAADDLEGEQELQKQAKQERAKKRKADLALTSVAGMRKKLKTDPTRPTNVSAPAKPSKKKERVTWVHDENSGRSSLRKQTIAHREETIARLKESEAQSKKLKALKAKRDKEKARDAPKELTQADRLAEAARVERQNAKSLNRWEAGERKRQEEQAAKLAALRDKKLEGAVVSWMSQKVKWTGQDISKAAIKDIPESTGPKKRGRKSKAELEQIAAGKAAKSTVPIRGPITLIAPTPVITPASDQPQPPIQGPMPELGPVPAPVPQPHTETPASEQHRDSFLMGIHEYANLQAESNASSSKPATPPPQTPDGQQDARMAEAPQPEKQTSPGADSNRPVMPDPPTESTTQAPPAAVVAGSGSESVVVKLEVSADQTLPPAILVPNQPAPTPFVMELEPVPEPPHIEEDSTRNLLILERFDELTSNTRREYSFFYNKKTTTRTAARAVKQNPELCLITALPVRYRDPSTGIAYANAIAYKKIQELKQHKYAWSSMLGCYIGLENGVVARGVPEGFA